MKRYLLNTIILLALTWLVLPVAQAQMKDGRVRRVVIDAGHGGKDPGAVGSASREKDIALSIALKTGKYISDQFPDVEVLYTRKTDVFVELDRRAKIANEAHADLFISIHCNSSKSKTPYGTETFVMGIHKSAANLEVAKLENAAILLEDNYSQRYEGYDPRSPESNIIFSLYQDSYREFSLGLATLIQEQFKIRSARFDRGVKEAGFWVLYRTAMPGVLVETGFISNRDEERYLRSSTGQMEIAATIFRAFRQYKANVEKNAVGSSPMQASSSSRATDNPDDALETPTDSPDENVVHSSVSDEKNAEDQTHNVGEGTDAGANDWLVPDLKFRVQIVASPEQIEKSDARFHGLSDLYVYEHSGMYKYTHGMFDTKEKAEAYRNVLKKKGFVDSFVVALYQDRRISYEQAQVLVDAARQAR